jgi:hypothetical protein
MEVELFFMRFFQNLMKKAGTEEPDPWGTPKK